MQGGLDRSVYAWPLCSECGSPNKPQPFGEGGDYVCVGVVELGEAKGRMCLLFSVYQVRLGSSDFRVWPCSAAGQKISLPACMRRKVNGLKLVCIHCARACSVVRLRLGTCICVLELLHSRVGAVHIWMLHENGNILRLAILRQGRRLRVEVAG